MMAASLTAAAVLFLKYGPYIVALKVCTSAIDVASAYIKHKITKE